ncbi:nitronate monooxygenase [Aspergillus candidus]|uniref:Putative oxidoreductase n=1 Tax=Aspergillus candidus TaxID=41067 RepID=A0A2I2F7U2_ASPCN|nr:putative oxidoreductase [Aspergillus candidus]PLB36692.1 putative oxidoreductase [Aspergillus candidus]
MSSNPTLQTTYPWVTTPLIASAPMLNISLPALAISVSTAGGLGFLAAGFDVSNLEQKLSDAANLAAQPTSPLNKHYADTGILPIGVGFINWGADLTQSIAAVEKYKPCAVWLFAPEDQPAGLIPWVERVRAATDGQTQIWVQVGAVCEAVAVAETLRPDVLVVQGADAGGHGLARSASVVTLVPEVVDALDARGLGTVPVLAAGGVVDGRGVAAALALGACGAVMGTRFLASEEANVARGYRDEILRAEDGGVSTVRSTVYDGVRGIHGWPQRYDGRGVINRSYVDAVEGGMSAVENQRLYVSELEKGDAGWGPDGRLTTYAGTGVGLVREALPAGEVVRSVRLGAIDIVKRIATAGN